MIEGPGIVGIAALIGDATRADLLMNLMAGHALTATELAHGAGVTKQTISSHLAKLLDARLVSVECQGRHRYYRLADDDVAQVLEALTGVAARTSALRASARIRMPGPREPALRKARVCYDHLAGELAVLVYESLQRQRLLRLGDGEPTLTPSGEQFFATMGIDVAALVRSRRPLCRACLDWSVRRHHLAGSLGAALLDRYFALGWARRAKGSRIVQFLPAGEKALRARFDLANVTK
jgi:DNA-binding transcriptional ArsR family regulator